MGKLNQLNDYDENFINNVYKKLQIVFEKLGCNFDSAYKTRLDNFEVANIQNILFFLKSIEEKINQLISIFYYKKFKVS